MEYKKLKKEQFSSTKPFQAVNASETWLEEFQKYGWDSINLTWDLFYTGVGHATQVICPFSHIRTN